MEGARTELDCQKAFTFAAIAWNLSLLPPGDLNVELQEMRKKLGADVGEVLGPMTARRIELFADVEREIIDFEVAMKGWDVQLSVLSSPRPPEVNRESAIRFTPS